MKAEILLTINVEFEKEPSPETFQKYTDGLVLILEGFSRINGPQFDEGITTVGGKIEAAMVSIEKPITPNREHDCATCPQELYDRCVTLPAHEKARRRLAARLN